MILLLIISGKLKNFRKTKKNEINVNVSQEKLDLRKKSWIKPDLKFKSGILYKYSKLVSSASKGCVTD